MTSFPNESVKDSELRELGAIEYYDKTLGIDPHNVIALNGKGAVLNTLGNYTGAIIYYDKALAIDPKYENALDNKGAALGNLGNHTGGYKIL